MPRNRGLKPDAPAEALLFRKGSSPIFTPLAVMALKKLPKLDYPAKKRQTVAETVICLSCKAP
jgi:hypothetical protein